MVGDTKDFVDVAALELGRGGALTLNGSRQPTWFEVPGAEGFTTDAGSYYADIAEDGNFVHGAVDLVGMALQLGATYVARGFSGDKAQLVPLIKGAIAHGGAAFIDVISPCVAFNNHAGSTRSYDHVREHNEALNRIDFIDLAPEAKADGLAKDPRAPAGSARSRRTAPRPKEPVQRLPQAGEVRRHFQRHHEQREREQVGAIEAGLASDGVAAPRQQAHDRQRGEADEERQRDRNCCQSMPQCPHQQTTIRLKAHAEGMRPTVEARRIFFRRYRLLLE